MPVLDREIRTVENNKIVIPKDIVYNNGSIIVKNVPHNKYLETTIDGKKYEEYTLSGNVSLKLSAITEYMYKNHINFFDFNEYHLYPEIDRILKEFL